jgi:hypothetical protein
MDAGGANVLYGSSSGLQASRPFRALTLTTNEHLADRLVRGIPNPSGGSWTSSTPRGTPQPAASKFSPQPLSRPHPKWSTRAELTRTLKARKKEAKSFEAELTRLSADDPKILEKR